MRSKFKHSLFTAMIFMLPLSSLTAAIVTWTGASTSDLTDASNWSPMTVPNGNSNVGTFVTNVAMNSLIVYPSGVSQTFTPGELDFTTDPFFLNAYGNNTTTGVGITFVTGGAGVRNTSGVFQNISVTSGAYLTFKGTSSADITVSGQLLYGSDGTNVNFPSSINFEDSTTASKALFHIGTITTATNAGLLSFSDTSTAGTATIELENTALLTFNDSSTANSASIQLNPAGPTAVAGTTTLSFLDSSKALLHN